MSRIYEKTYSQYSSAGSDFILALKTFST